MIRAAALALALALLPSGLVAEGQTQAQATGLLGNEDFFRVVACAAPPGGECTGPFMRWEASRPIRVALREMAPGYLGRRAKVADASVTLALRALNAVGREAGFRLARVGASDPAEIEVWFLDLPRGAPIAGTGVEGVDGIALGAATTRLLFNHDTGFIERAAIVVSGSLATADFQPVLLAEFTQAMGLTHPIEAPAYDGISVLAQGPQTATKLGLQDIFSLKSLYERN